MSDRTGPPFARLTAEFAVIVIGVLVALLAESAWEERGERAEEADILERLRAELVLDAEFVSLDLRFYGQLPDIAEQAQDVVRGTSSLSPEASLAVLLLAGATRNEIRDPRTFDDLLASGRLGLIRDPELRQALMVFYGDFDDALAMREAVPSDVSDTFLAWVPVSWASRVLDECLREEPGADGGIPTDLMVGASRCTIAPPGGAEELLRRVRAAPDLEVDLGLLAHYAFEVWERWDRASRSLVRLEAALGQQV